MGEVSQHITDTLTVAILKAYKAGIKAVVEKNKNSILKTGKEPAFNTYDEKFKPEKEIDVIAGKKIKTKQSPIFDIDYTAEDLEAIRNFRIEAFTVATIGEYEIQEKLKELAIRTIREKESDFEYFKKEARRISNRYIRGDWLETNLKTAASSSYRAAEWTRLQDPDVKSIYPAYQYKTRNDSRVRDEHRALANKVFRSHDPIWKSIWPPNGWNCRCYTMPLSQEEVVSGQYKIENELRNESETRQLLKDAFPNPKDAKNFMRNPGVTNSIFGKWIDEKLSGLDKTTASSIKKAVKEFGKSIKDELTLKKSIPVKSRFKIYTNFKSLENYNFSELEIKLLNENGIKIEIDNTIKVSKFEGKKIMLRNSADLPHELGHMISDLNGFLHNSKMFRSVYSENKNEVAKIILLRLVDQLKMLKNMKEKDFHHFIFSNNPKGLINLRDRKYFRSKPEIFAQGYELFRIDPEFKNYAINFQKYFEYIVNKLKKVETKKFSENNNDLGTFEGFLKYAINHPGNSHVYFPVITTDPNYDEELCKKYLVYKDDEVINEEDFL